MNDNINELKTENLKKKILLIGLDNCGKTSIAFCLMGIKNIMSFSLIKPTKGVNIDTFQTLGSEYTIWDYGGQEQYRQNHIKNLRNHILKANKIIYVIDIQDTERYDLALDYLNVIIKIIVEHKYIVDFSIFLHKWDPDFALFKKEIDENLVEKLVKNIRKSFPSYFKFIIQKTSIYAVFQKTNI